jgi:hypothetical protein
LGRWKKSFNQCTAGADAAAPVVAPVAGAVKPANPPAGALVLNEKDMVDFDFVCPDFQKQKAVRRKANALNSFIMAQLPPKPPLDIRDLQARVRDNAETLSNFVSELNDWEADVKKREAELAQKKAQRAAATVPVR